MYLMEENLVISDIEAPPVVHAGVGVGLGAGSEEQQQQQLVVTEISSIEELGYGTEQLLELNNSYYGSEIAQVSYSIPWEMGIKNGLRKQLLLSSPKKRSF